MGEYRDLYLKSNTLQLPFLKIDVFKNSIEICLDIYQVDLAKCIPRLVWQAALKKKIKVELELLTNIDMLLMVEKRIRGVIYHSIKIYAKANNKYLKDYDKNKQLSYLKYWDINNLYGCAMSQMRQ